MQTTDRDFCKMFLYTYIIADFVEKSRRGDGVKELRKHPSVTYGASSPKGEPNLSHLRCQLSTRHALRVP